MHYDQLSQKQLTAELLLVVVDDVDVDVVVITI